MRNEKGGKPAICAPPKCVHVTAYAFIQRPTCKIGDFILLFSIHIFVFALYLSFTLFLLKNILNINITIKYIYLKIYSYCIWKMVAIYIKMCFMYTKNVQCE